MVEVLLHKLNGSVLLLYLVHIDTFFLILTLFWLGDGLPSSSLITDEKKFWVSISCKTSLLCTLEKQRMLPCRWPLTCVFQPSPSPWSPGEGNVLQKEATAHRPPLRISPASAARTGSVSWGWLQDGGCFPMPWAPGCARGPCNTASGTSAPPAQHGESCCSLWAPDPLDQAVPLKTYQLIFCSVLLYSRLFGLQRTGKAAKWLHKAPWAETKQNSKTPTQAQNTPETNKQKRISVVWLNRSKIPYSVHRQT